jgi:hypothetical protein
MIRTLIVAAGLFTLTAGSVVAAPTPARSQRIAQTGPRTGDTAKEPGKKTKRERKSKKAKGAEGLGMPTSRSR